MKNGRWRAAALCATLIAGAPAYCGGEPAYRLLVPIVSAELSSLSHGTRLLYDGLSGIGVKTSTADCSARIAEALMLPSLAGADTTRPVFFFLLAQNPPSALPEPAAIVPMKPNGGEELLKALSSRYSFVDGKSVKVCSGAIDGVSVDPLYVAVAEGNAMISPNIDAIRWMAYNLQSKTIHDSPGFRKASLLASVDGPLLSRLLELAAAAIASDEPEGTATNGIPFNLHDASSFASSFSRIDLAIDASIRHFDIATRLVPPEGPMSTAFRSLNPPPAKWSEYFPPFACNKAASPLPGLVAALPRQNRRWLSDLASTTRLVGFQTLPAAFDLDETIRPLMTGENLTSFVVDKPGGRIGAISIFGLQAPEKAKAAILSYFSQNGGVAGNARINNASVKINGAVTTYDLAQGASERPSPGSGNAGAALSHLFDLNHVEFTVKDNRLIVAQGSSHLIDGLLNDKTASSWSESISSLTEIFPAQPGETVLGGGSLEPVFLAKKIIEASPSIAYLAAKIPHAGNGFAWRMSRQDNSLIFDFRLYSNEILACNMIRALDSTTLQELLSQLVIRHFRISEESGTKHDRIRDTLMKMRNR